MKRNPPGRDIFDRTQTCLKPPIPRLPVRRGPLIRHPKRIHTRRILVTDPSIPAWC